MSNNNESMEIQLLREMIQDREARMVRIQSKADDLQQKSKRLAGELEQVSKENTDSSIVLTTERTQLMHLRQKAIDQLETTERDFQRQSTSLQSFAQIVAKQTSNQKDMINVDIAFVSKMQAQLCKAMHSMGILDHQMELCKKHADAHIKAEKENLVLVTEELSSVELNLMNELMRMDTERREVENDLTKQLDDVRKDIKAMQEQLGEGSDDENSDEESQKESDEEEENEEQEKEESEEEDEEEREIKEELMNVLQEKKDELRKLEKSIEEYEEQILELEEHVEEMKAQAEDAAKRRAKKIEENGGIDPDARPVTPDAADQNENDDPDEPGQEKEGDEPNVLDTENETTLPVHYGVAAGDLVSLENEGLEATEEREPAALEDSSDVRNEENELDQEAHNEEIVQDMPESILEKSAEEAQTDATVTNSEDHVDAGIMLNVPVQADPPFEESVDGEENQNHVSSSYGDEDLAQNDSAESNSMNLDEPADIDLTVENLKKEEPTIEAEEKSTDLAANEELADSGTDADAVIHDVTVTDGEIGNKAAGADAESGVGPVSQSSPLAEETSEVNEMEERKAPAGDVGSEKLDADESSAAISVTGTANDTGADATPEVEHQINNIAV
ncbi:hypothetical protein FisN_24Lh003 [Fistulifera solaris]|uniref:Uncharacterized protein n=1 Tax=Fistulifera solaris TaxID=1519565 RepID=A0A1Z5JAP5_FISSO|nr:hypothetical protein FisN_24Lh003 [Fistulifera solaris]|eukprot:GAX11060.1 hypothetical protein FisN_24Lh003 [Fistulifera solaris]